MATAASADGDAETAETAAKAAATTLTLRQVEALLDEEMEAWRLLLSGRCAARPASLKACGSRALQLAINVQWSTQMGPCMRLGWLHLAGKHGKDRTKAAVLPHPASRAALVSHWALFGGSSNFNSSKTLCIAHVTLFGSPAALGLPTLCSSVSEHLEDSTTGYLESLRAFARAMAKEKAGAADNPIQEVSAVSTVEQP